jgi:hypothetical protein
MKYLVSFFIFLNLISVSLAKSSTLDFIKSPKEFTKVGNIDCEICDSQETTKRANHSEVKAKTTIAADYIGLFDLSKNNKYFIFFQSNLTFRKEKQTPAPGRNLGFTPTNEWISLMAKNISGETRERLLNADFTELVGTVTDAFNISKDQATYPRVVYAATLVEASKAKTTDDFLNVFKKRSGSLNNQQKINFMRYILFQLSENYDDDRADDDHPSSDGSVPLNQIKNALFQNIFNEVDIKAGVCRDIVQAGLLIAKAMGLEHSYGIGYQTTKGSSHRELLIANLKDKNLTIINYDIQSEAFGITGVKALEVNNEIPSSGFEFRLTSDQNIREITLPSELGLTLHKMTGGSQDQIMLGSNPMPDIHQVGLGIKDIGKVRLFYSESNQGTKEQTTGLALSTNKKFFDFINIAGGFALYKSERPTFLSTLSQSNLYLSFQPSLELHKKIGGTSIDLEAGLSSRVSTGCNHLGASDCKKNNESSLNGFAKARLTQNLFGLGYASIYSKAIIDNTPTDSTDNSTDQKIKIPMYSIGSDLSFGSNLIFKIGGEIFYYDLGNETFVTSEGRASVAYLPSGTLLEASTTQILTSGKDTLVPIFLPNSNQQSKVRLGQDLIFAPLRLGVQGQINHDVPGLSSMMLTIGNH